ncbi:MAG: hypothetical protein AAFQ82_05465 [Myxococcota bacterium]
MSELYLYLRNGLLTEQGLRPELEKGAMSVARHWLTDGIDSSAVELTSEFLARMAEALSDPGAIQKVRIVAAVEAFETSDVNGALLTLVDHAVGESASSRELAALALHLLDISEHMALKVYVAELPSLLARADRSGDAARNVGIARHLRG